MKSLILKGLLLIVLIGFVFYMCQQDKPYFEYFEQTDSPIIGVWEVYESANIPFEHISYCEELNVGTKFVFDYLGRLYVFKKEKKRYCNKEQIYIFNDSIIEIIEYDMPFNYQITRLDSDTLNLYFFYDDNSLKLKKIANSM